MNRFFAFRVSSVWMLASALAIFAPGTARAQYSVPDWGGFDASYGTGMEFGLPSYDFGLAGFSGYGQSPYTNIDGNMHFDMGMYSAGIGSGQGIGTGYLTGSGVPAENHYRPKTTRARPTPKAAPAAKAAATPKATASAKAAASGKGAAKSKAAAAPKPNTKN
jgi:hypothetical protein